MKYTNTVAPKEEDCEGDDVESMGGFCEMKHSLASTCHYLTPASLALHWSLLQVPGDLILHSQPS
jgi:hypothetical protein